MLCDIGLGSIDIPVGQLCDESRNPLAFVHEESNLLVAQMMSKRARTCFFRETCRLAQAGELTRPAWLCYHR